MNVLWGIDYGKKRSGNTVICERQEKEVHFFQAEKNKDADQFILSMIREAPPDRIFIDAPLSLPGAFYDETRYNDFFFRQCDQQIGGMSPMFLGGLTARAIRLKSIVSRMNIPMMEAYPGGLSRHLKLKDYGYRRGKEKIGDCADIILESAQLELDKSLILSWHHIDALLALVTAIRHEQGLSFTYGNKDEGLVYI
jgi:predicted nuclease with RNAse H fold